MPIQTVTPQKVITKGGHSLWRVGFDQIKDDLVVVPKALWAYLVDKEVQHMTKMEAMAYLRLFKYPGRSKEEDPLKAVRTLFDALTVEEQWEFLLARLQGAPTYTNYTAPRLAKDLLDLSTTH